MVLAFRYFEDKDAILEENYPYVSGETKKKSECKYEEKKHTAVEVQSFKNVAKDEPRQLMAAIKEGPTSVAIEADKTVFQHYTHGVLAVGYGEADEGEYVLVKNSWGPTWG